MCCLYVEWMKLKVSSRSWVLESFDSGNKLKARWSSTQNNKVKSRIGGVREQEESKNLMHLRKCQCLPQPQVLLRMAAPQDFSGELLWFGTWISSTNKPVTYPMLIRLGLVPEPMLYHLETRKSLPSPHPHHHPNTAWKESIDISTYIFSCNGQIDSTQGHGILNYRYVALSHDCWVPVWFFHQWKRWYSAIPHISSTFAINNIHFCKRKTLRLHMWHCYKNQKRKK